MSQLIESQAYDGVILWIVFVAIIIFVIGISYYNIKEVFGEEPK